jgi:GntR family transcriptional regulator, rspAB operon transcriptional repressor
VPHKPAADLQTPSEVAVLAPIGRVDQSFADLAYRALKEAIMSLALPPGSALSERQLGEQLHVSKTPIREALARLEGEGFAVTLPYRGTLVTTLSRDDIREIFDLRALLEGHAVFQAAADFTPEAIAELRQCVDAAATAETNDDARAYFDANHRFHQIFIERTWNRRLHLQLTNLEAHARRIRTATAPVWRLIGMDLKYHREVLTAVEQGDAELARDALQRDIREFERLLLSNTSEGMLSLLGQDAPPRTGQLGSA